MTKVKGKTRFIPALDCTAEDVMVLVLIPLWMYVFAKVFA